MRASDRPARKVRRLLHIVLAVALAFPGVASPCTLEQLLRLPLERLLQLEVAPGRGVR